MDKQIKLNLHNLLINKKYDDVLIILDKFPENEKQENIYIFFYYYKVYMGLKLFSKSEYYLDKLLLIEEKNSTYWRDRGICHQDKNELEKALYCYDKAINLKPEISSYYIFKANILKLLENFTEAIENYILALELNPEQKTWKKNLTQLITENNKLLEANKPLKELTKHKSLSKCYDDKLLTLKKELSNYELIKNNDDGLFTWTLAPLLRSLANMYFVTKNQKYKLEAVKLLEKLLNYKNWEASSRYTYRKFTFIDSEMKEVLFEITSAFSSRNDSTYVYLVENDIFIENETRKFKENFSISSLDSFENENFLIDIKNNSFSSNKIEIKVKDLKYNFSVQTGLLIYSLLESSEKLDYKISLFDLEQMFGLHTKEFNFDDETGAYYIPSNAPVSYNNIKAPYNHQSSMGLAALLLYNYTKKDYYKNIAKKIFNDFISDNQIFENIKNWKYTYSSIRLEDIGHAEIVIRFIGNFISDSEKKQLLNIVNNFIKEDYKLSLYIDGSSRINKDSNYLLSLYDILFFDKHFIQKAKDFIMYSYQEEKYNERFDLDANYLLGLSNLILHESKNKDQSDC